MNALANRIGYWRWLWTHKQWWFLRELPPAEWDTVLFTGLPGSGKTVFGCGEAISYMRSGVHVASNVYIRDTFTGQEATPIRGWLDVLRQSVYACENHEPVLIYIAEIHELCDARLWQQTPAWWIELMSQRRHLGLGLMADTQHVDQVEKRLRMLIGRLVQIEPSLIRRWWRRWPVFKWRGIDMQLGDDPKDWKQPGPWKLIWQLSHAFHGHSSWELVGSQTFEDLNTPEIQAEIEDLRQRAVACNAISYLAAYPDGDAVVGSDDSKALESI